MTTFELIVRLLPYPPWTRVVKHSDDGGHEEVETVKYVKVAVDADNGKPGEKMANVVFLDF